MRLWRKKAQPVERVALPIPLPAGLVKAVASIPVGTTCRVTYSIVRRDESVSIANWSLLVEDTSYFDGSVDYEATDTWMGEGHD